MFPESEYQRVAIEVAMILLLRPNARQVGLKVTMMRQSSELQLWLKTYGTLSIATCRIEYLG